MNSFRKLSLISLSILTMQISTPVCSFAQTPVEISQNVITMQDGNKYHLHTVMRKQTLFSIARAYNVDQQSIIDKNPSLLTNPLRVKQTILIPTVETYKLMLAPKTTQDKTTPAPAESTTIIAPHATTIIGAQDASKLGDDTVAHVERKAIDFSRPLIVAPAAGQPINVTMLMPFSTTAEKNENSSDFFEGALLALKLMKNTGVNVNLKLLSTEDDPARIRAFIENGQLNGSNLIIGPVYSDTFEVASAWALENNVPIVSPLTTVEVNDNPFVVQMPPLAINKYGQLRTELHNPLNNVVLLRPTDNFDQAALAEFESMIPLTAQTLNYSRATAAGSLAALLSKEKNNIILVPANPVIAEEVLSKIAATNAPIKRFDIQTVGTSRWRSLVNMNNAELLFKTNTTYPSSYYADRSNPQVDQFYQDYISNFNRLPSLFSMRGYDVTAIMIGSLAKWGEQTLVNMNGQEFHGLQMPYKFSKAATHDLVNEKWVMVRHTPDFIIEAQ